ncbi:NAD(+) diphosphatase [Thiotrichales bacterium 19S9-12]|nr:NAD(+) diphosphatase [Thiotrichales bacterium 19S9-11]MCF6811778.1 NAD(+) diphosphatase [Thiotrichales bacterium 19S9-12]
MEAFTQKTAFIRSPLNGNIKPKDNDYLFIYDHKRRMALDDFSPVVFHKVKNSLTHANFYAFGQINEQACFICYPNEPYDTYPYMDLRFVFDKLDESVFQAASYASHLAYWHEVNRHCSACGKEMTDKDDEQARACSQCGHVVYTQISPSIIVLIKKDDELLLARSHYFTTGRYSLVAGYVEPGETLEQAVEREVFEEVGIKVRNIQYKASQPWPFSSSLMIGFSADYDSGEIKIDPQEIEDAQWFKINQLPELPTEISIAYQLITNYCKDIDLLHF